MWSLYIVYCKLIAVHDIVYIVVIQETHFNRTLHHIVSTHVAYLCNTLIFTPLHSFVFGFPGDREPSFRLCNIQMRSHILNTALENPIIQVTYSEAICTSWTDGHCGCCGSPITQVYKDTHNHTETFLFGHELNPPTIWIMSYAHRKPVRHGCSEPAVYNH